MASGERHCPDCRAPLHEVSAEARTGYLLALDQCAACGGLWFDRWELFPLSHHEVARLDAVDAERLMSEHAAAATPGPCPRCAIPLRPFRDPVLPPDARIDRCAVCEGMWLQRGELRRLRAPAAARHAASFPLRDKEIRRVARHYGEESKWSQVKDLDAATHSVEEAPPDPAELGSALWSAAPWVILQMLLRFVFKR